MRDNVVMARVPDATVTRLRCDTVEPLQPGQRPNADDDADISSEGSVQEERQLKEKIRKLAQDGLVEELCAAVEELSLLVRATECEKYEAKTRP